MWNFHVLSGVATVLGVLLIAVSGQQFSSLLHQKNTSGTGVRVLEMPTIDILAPEDRKKSDVPRENGSRSNLAKIEICCSGYERIPHTFIHCKPICDKGCENGNCIAPNVCTCKRGFIKLTAEDQNKCIPTCPEGCLNGVCTNTGECNCNYGYSHSPDRKYCVAVCSGGCGPAGRCTEPETCSCSPGFYVNKDTNKCEYFCEDGCEQARYKQDTTLINDIKGLLNKVDINYKDKDGDTFLHAAIQEEHRDVVKLILEKGAKTDIKNNKDKTPLSLANDIDDRNPNKQSIIQMLDQPRQRNKKRKHDQSSSDPNKTQKPYQDNGNSKKSNLAELEKSKAVKRPNNDQEVPNKKVKLPSQKYSKSGLVHTLHGDIYQLKLLMLFVKRALDRGYLFELATEMDAAEKFDDLVFQYRKNIADGTEEKVGRFLQAKHKQDEDKKISVNDLLTETNGEFSLQKYFISYRKIQQNREFKNSNLQHKDFVICTNIGFKFGDKRRNLELSENIFNQETDENDILNTKLFQFKDEFTGKEEIFSVLKNAPDLTKLAKALAECVLDGKSISDDKPKHDQEGNLFKLYQSALIDKVIDRESYKLSVDFVKGQRLSSRAENLRAAFKKVFDDRRKSFYLDDEPIIEDPKNFAQEVAKLIKNQPNKVVRVEKRKRVIKDNFNKLAGYVLIKKDNKIKFSTAFLNNHKLSGNLDIFREELQSLSRNLDQYEFKTYKEFKTCEEIYVDKDNFWEKIKEKELKLFKNFGKLDANLQSTEKFVEKFVSLLEENESKENRVVKVKRTDRIINNNIDKLAQHVLIEEKDEIRFSSEFLSDTQLPGNLNDFRSQLKAKLKKLNFDLNVLKEYKFYISNFPKFDLPNESINEIEENIKDFLKELRFAVNQPNEDKLGDMMKDEWGKEFNTIDRKNIYGRFLEKMLDWMKDKEGNLFTHKEGKIFFEEIKKEILGAIWFDVKDPVGLFTGRKKELSDLHSKVQRNSEKPTVISQMTSISGLGGIGKTELARKYAYDHGNDYNDNVIWINAENLNTIENSFRKLAKDNRLGIPTKDGDGKDKTTEFIVKEIYQFFAKKKSLFIFDNAEKNYNLNNFLPLRSLTPDSNKPYILITSRNREWEKGIEVIDLNKLKLEDAIKFVKEGLSIKDESQDKGIKALVEKLQRFPLAIQQAIAYIEDQDKMGKFNIDDYLEEYKKKTEDLLNSEAFRGMANDYAKTTLTTWKVTIDKIARDKEHGRLALKVLNNIAYFAPENINREIFLDLAGGDEVKLKSAVRLLVKYSMVNGEQNQSVLSIHRLVQQVTRIELEGQGEDKEVVRKIFGLLKKSFPYGKDTSEDYSRKKELLPHLEAFLSHIDGWVAKNTEDKEKIEKSYILNLLIWMDDGYEALGDSNKQRELLERALAIEEKHYGLEHFEVAITLVNLGNAYGGLGDPNKQRELLERALAIKEKHYGLEHFEVARTLVNLGNAYGALGDPNKQRELLERARAIEEKHYGFEHFEVARTLVNLGNAYGNLGDHKKKKELLEGALVIEEKYYGLEHFEVARTLVSLGNAYGALGDPNKQRELLERALAIKEKHYGLEYFEVARTLGNLGDAYGDVGDYKKKKELLERALAIKEKHYGLEHFEVARTLGNLGDAYGDVGDYKKKKELLERALAIKEKHYGLEHFEVAITLVNLGKAYGALGDPNKEQELLERALAIEEKHYGLEHFEVARTLVNLGNAYGDLGDHKKKKELLERALAIKEKYYGLEHFEVARTLVNLGNAYGDLGDHKKKKELLERVLPILERHYGFDHFQITKTLANLGRAYGNLGNTKKACELYEKASRANEQTPLHLAAQGGNLYVVQHFMKKGADVLATNNHDTVLHSAVSSGNEEIVRLILDKIKEKDPQNFSEHINAKDTEGDTPLMWAAETGKTNTAKMLLEYGADPSVENNDGKTALNWAANGGYQEFVQLLLEKQLNPISVTDESMQRKKRGAVSLEECLPSTSPGRSKREAKIGKCELSWEDVDEFNTEKNEKRDFSKINIDGKKFVDYIKDLPEEKRSQLIQLADKVKVTIESQSLVNKLIGNQKVISHLNRVEKISGMTMHGMMAKNVLADFLNGDYQGVAINVGFIGGGQGFAKVAEAASLKGLKLASEGKLLLGRSLRAASPFLARGTSAFVIYDLVNQVKAFKNGTEEAFVGVIGDTIYLGVDAAEIGVEVAEAFEVLEGVSSVTGPIGAAVGALVFVGTDVYVAVKRVDKIDENIHLTGKERFVEGLHAFIGMQPEKHIQELMQEKQLYNQLVKQRLEYLQQHDGIQSVVFPTEKSVVDSCHRVPYKTSECNSGGLGGGCFNARTVTRYAEECTTKFEVDLDNTVLLDRKRANIKWSRAKPDNPKGGQLFCLPHGSYIFAPNYGSYLCKSAIGITDLSTNKTGNHTLIDLGEGEDYAEGFIDSPNIFVVNNGYKQYQGGSKDDVFILQGNSIKGYLYGEGGINTLDLTGFALKAKNIDVVLNRGDIIYDNHHHHILKAFGMNKVLGRRDKVDRIFSKCDTQLLDGKGGAENNLDVIVIDNNNCTYKMQMIVRPNTIISNRASEGDFYYTVPYALGSAEIDFSYSSELLNSNNSFFFEYSPADIKNVSIENVKVFNKTSQVVTFNFSPASGKKFNITVSGASNPSYRLGNNTEIKVGKKGNLYVLENTNKSVDEIIKDYLVVANRLNKISFFIQTLLSNETVAIGSGNYEVIHNNPLQKSRLVGNGGENVYVIDCEIKRFKVHIPEVVIYDLDVESSVDTIDLRNLVQQARDEFSNSFKLRVLKSANDLLLKATVENPTRDSSISEVRRNEYFTIRLKDGVNWYKKTHVITDNVPMRISLDNNEWSLRPQPLIFEKDKEIIVVTSHDVEENTELITPKRAGSYSFARDNGSDLMITNAFDANVAEYDLCTIVFSKFYETSKMETLSIKFADKEIILKDHQEQISSARDVNVVKKEYKDQVYNDVFNRTKSRPEVIMLYDQPVTHRHGHKHHIRNRRSEYTISSGIRSSSRINDLFGWVQNLNKWIVQF